MIFGELEKNLSYFKQHYYLVITWYLTFYPREPWKYICVCLRILPTEFQITFSLFWIILACCSSTDTLWVSRLSSNVIPFEPTCIMELKGQGLYQRRQGPHPLKLQLSSWCQFHMLLVMLLAAETFEGIPHIFL